MPMRSTLCLVVVTSLSALVPPRSSAQTLTVAPTFQQSLASYDSRVADLLRGEQHFQAWGVMVGLERPGRFWQPHLWYQRFEFGNPCPASTDVRDCVNDGWSLSVGPGLQVFQTPHLSGMVLATAGIQARGGGVTGGAGFHVGVRMGRLQPSAFGRYQIIRGVHYATVGAGLVLELPFGRGSRD